MTRLLAPFAYEELDEFKRDFTPLMRMTIELDSEYGDASEKALYNLPIYRKYVAMFNSKYKGVFAVFTESTEGFKLRLFIRDVVSVSEVFNQAASQIEGLTSIGTAQTESIPVYNKREFMLQMRQIHKRLHITYSNEASVILKYDDAKKMVEIIYNPKEILNEDSPAYKLCMFYALKRGYDSEISLKSIAGQFSAAAKGAGRTGYGPNR